MKLGIGEDVRAAAWDEKASEGAFLAFRYVVTLADRDEDGSVSAPTHSMRPARRSKARTASQRTSISATTSSRMTATISSWGIRSRSARISGNSR